MASSNSPSPMDYKEHEKTYNLFLGLVKWGTIGTIVTLLLMLVTLVK